MTRGCLVTGGAGFPGTNLVRMELVETLPDTEAKLRYLESTLAPAGAGAPVRRLETTCRGS